MTDQEELLRVVEQHEIAYTRAEVEMAEAAFRSFKERHPNYPINPELFHGWIYKLDALKEREAVARALQLTAAQIEERDALFKSVRWTGPEDGELYDAIRLMASKDRLLHWLERFPDDVTAVSHLETVFRDLEIAALLGSAEQDQGHSEAAPATRDLVTA